MIEEEHPLLDKCSLINWNEWKKAMGSFLGILVLIFCFVFRLKPVCFEDDCLHDEYELAKHIDLKKKLDLR